MKFDDIASRALLRTCIAQWWLFLAIEAVATILALAAFVVLPREYDVVATVIGTRYASDVTPVSAPSTLSAAAIFGRTPNSLPAVTDFNLYSTVLISPELGAGLVNDNVLKTLFKLRRSKGKWLPPDTIVQSVTNFIDNALWLPPWSPPDGFAIAERLNTVLNVDPDKNSQMVTITYRCRDRAAGAAVINTLHYHADALVRRMAQKRLQDKVDFLKRELEETSANEARTALGNALAKAEIDRLYSLSNLPFAAEFLAPPAAAKEPVFPQFWILAAAFAAIGALLFFANAFAATRGVNLLPRPVRKADLANGHGREAALSKQTSQESAGTPIAKRNVAG